LHFACTAPPCELRIAVEEIGFIFQRASHKGSDTPQYGEATTTMHGWLWQQLLSATSSSLARTDQQGYGVVVVQWLLGSSSDHANTASPHEEDGDVEIWSAPEASILKNDIGEYFHGGALGPGIFDESIDEVNADQRTLAQGGDDDHWAFCED
jgi:hypothetical protein